MARIEYIKFRLNNWALWKARENAGGLGFARRSVMFAEPSGGYRESVVPVDDVDASVTNDAVESLKGAHRHLYEVLQTFYVSADAGSVRGVAARLGKGASTVSTNLDQADLALSIWFRQRAGKINLRHRDSCYISCKLVLFPHLKNVPYRRQKRSR
jgi:hypothetical protein